MGQQRCFWVPRVVVFETHNAKKYCVGSGWATESETRRALLSEQLFGRHACQEVRPKRLSLPGIERGTRGTKMHCFSTDILCDREHCRGPNFDAWLLGIRAVPPGPLGRCKQYSSAEHHHLCVVVEILNDSGRSFILLDSWLEKNLPL